MRPLGALLLALLLAPCAWLAYLPMTDLPQHLAIASILRHTDDPRFGFGAYYEAAYARSFYLLPYLFVNALAPLLPLEAAMRLLVVLALAALPLGVFFLLRALGKPEWLALLALPLVYNRAFFWGFVSFQLALGLALFALALLVRPRRGLAAELALALVTALIVFAHPYGVLIVAGYVGVWWLLGERRALARHAPALLPLALGAGAWLFAASAAEPTLRLRFDPLLERLDDFEESVLGGYRDASEAWILLAFVVVWGALAARVFPVSRRRWDALRHHERVCWVFVGVNFLLYAGLPSYTSFIGEIHVRHAVLATALLPLLAAPPRRRERLAKGALVLLALAAAANAWLHLERFDREARGFDAVVERIPYGARILALTWDANGAVMRTKPYWHFAAYAQARRGGLVAQTFPAMFWNLPVRLREDAGLPATPAVLFAKPYLFDYERFGYAYDHVLVRQGETEGRDRFARFPYRLVFEAPPWQLWRRPGP